MLMIAIRDDPERGHRIREILELECEPMNEAWAQLDLGLGDESAENKLGFSINYFNRLIRREFIRRIESGNNYIDFPSMSLALECQCWRDACKKVIPNLSQEINSRVSRQLRLKILSLHHENKPLEAIADYFDLEMRVAKPIFVLSLVEEGHTIREISIQLKLSSERTRRLLLETGQSVKSIKELKSAEQSIQQSDSGEKIANWVREHPGCFTQEIASALHLPDIEIWKLCPSDSRHLILITKASRNFKNLKKYSNDEILEALRKAYDLRNPMMSMYSSYETRPLSGPYYEKARKEGTIFGPSQARILQIFGTWKKACDEAGVPSINAVRDVYSRRWTDEDLIKQLAEYLLVAKSPSFQNFDPWSKLDESRASSGTIRNQIGHWSISCDHALYFLRSNWAIA